MVSGVLGADVRGVLQLQDMRNVYKNCILVSALCFLVRPEQHVSGSQNFCSTIVFEVSERSFSSV